MKQINVKFSGYSGLLGVAFIVLKLTKVIDWSWFWVLLPFTWVFVLLVGGAFITAIGFGVVYCGAWILDKTKKWRINRK